jgi:hypothetical protein
MIADQKYVTEAIRKAVAKLANQSAGLRERFDNYNQLIRSVPGATSQQINFAFIMQRLENDMLQAQKVEDIGISKRLMGQLCNQIIGIISKQYALNLPSAESFRKRIMALQFACYIQKRYPHRSEYEKEGFILKMNNMISGENIMELDNDPHTFAANIAAVIRELLAVIKADLPSEYEYNDELIDQIAEISSFDGGTAEIYARHYNINVPKLHKTNILSAKRRNRNALAEMVI